MYPKGLGRGGRARAYYAATSMGRPYYMVTRRKRKAPRKQYVPRTLGKANTSMLKLMTFLFH